MTLIQVPVIQVEKWAQKGYPLWWENNPNTHLLVNYFEARGYKGIKRILKFPGTLWVDSGGFEILKHGETTTPEEVIDFQNEEADVAFALDKPVTWEMDEQEIVKCLEITKDWLERGFKRARVKFYSVLHGPRVVQNPVKYMRIGWNNIKDYPTDGVAIASVKKTLYLALGFLLSQEVKNVHVFAIEEATPLYSAIHRYFRQLSFDSSKWIRLGQFRTYIIPLVSNTKIRLSEVCNEAHSVLLSNLEELPCDCPFCSSISVKELLGDYDKQRWLFGSHNFYWLNKRIRYLSSLPQKIAEEIAKEEGYGEQVEFIKACYEVGFDDAIKKYPYKPEASALW